MSSSDLLSEVKLLKGVQDDTQDKLIRLIIDDSKSRILSKINELGDKVLTELPDSITFIVRDVAIKRYNRLNSEGTIIDVEEGRSFHWEKNYLDEYLGILSAVAGKTKPKGVVRFL